jgi:hypothetical protein
MAHTEREIDKTPARGVASIPELDTALAGGSALWIQLILLQLAVIAGFVLASGSRDSSGAWQALSNGHWQSILLALATMTVGFGGAALLYRRLAGRQSDQLEKDYQSLVTRADSLLKSSQSEAARRASRPTPAVSTAAPAVDLADLTDRNIRTAASVRDTVQEAALASAPVTLKAAGATPGVELDVSHSVPKEGSLPTSRAEKSLFETIEQNPLLVAGAGLVIGGLIASAFPASRVEDERDNEGGNAVKGRARDAAMGAVSAAFDEGMGQADAASRLAEDRNRGVQDVQQRLRRVAESTATASERGRESTKD